VQVSVSSEQVPLQHGRSPKHSTPAARHVQTSFSTSHIPEQQCTSRKHGSFGWRQMQTRFWSSQRPEQQSKKLSQKLPTKLQRHWFVLGLHSPEQQLMSSVQGAPGLRQAQVVPSRQNPLQQFRSLPHSSPYERQVQWPASTSQSPEQQSKKLSQKPSRGLHAH
jgi:hypothetical protein